MDYNPFLKTAIKRKALSKPMKILLDKELLVGEVLDYGCGFGEDQLILTNYYGLSVAGYDKYNLEFNNDSLLNMKYDTITCNYVFNVIPSLKEHKNLIKALKELSNNIYICVRSDKKSIKNNWIYKSNEMGYWTTNLSFQRFYDKELVIKLFGEVEFVSSTSSLQLFKLK